MKIKEITYSKSRKVGLPNYSSVDVSCFVTAELDEGEADSDEVRGKLKNYVQREIDHLLLPYGISNEIKDAHDAREAIEPGQNFPGISEKTPYAANREDEYKQRNLLRAEMNAKKNPF